MNIQNLNSCEMKKEVRRGFFIWGDIIKIGNKKITLELPENEKGYTPLRGTFDKKQNVIKFSKDKLLYIIRVDTSKVEEIKIEEKHIKIKDFYIVETTGQFNFSVILNGQVKKYNSIYGLIN